MITGELKNKIDSLWEIFWTGGLTNPLDVIEQMTYLMFIHDLDDSDNIRAKEAAMLGICKWIFGKTELISVHPWPFVDPFVYALPLSLLTLIVVSLFTAKPKAEHLDRCFKDIK